jgi:4-hydroxy-L-threonine phosphate dehydrogenase PdxA
VVIKALAGGAGPARQLLVGDAQVVRDTIALTAAPFAVNAISRFEDARFEPGCLDVLDPGTLDQRDIAIGQLSAACGRAVTEWWDITTRLAREGLVKAAVKGPTNSEAVKLGGGGGGAAPAPADPTYLFLITGPLRVVHLTDHIPLRDVFGHVRKDQILRLIRLIDASLKSWGVPAPKIGVAGINPHARGDEERQEIAPAIEAARELGIDAQGPVSPDSLFRLGTEGAYDCVIAHYHDQGHIAVKTWRFDGNCAVMLGEPYLRISVAHGTAFDIAGRGIADHRSMASAMNTAAMLAAGQGFPRE